MYTAEQISKLKSQFWTSFGQYMKPVPSASGGPVNWINYKTGIRNIHFKMEADTTKAVIAIEIAHANEAERLQYYNQFVALKKYCKHHLVGNGMKQCIPVTKPSAA